ncbi:hypothetical protein Y032_0039g45 [Ancylostoma ceylanicum]|uniref:G-protein coupled receptors family 1 profile domain-containing protein n=1 Tax=Ancylostoma ceylanicum TaxID=53326 RepID=A0A016UJ30_9BILA|nr:hypothetical protein Y032_0039g45 [Ancylostoma ceylanicum]
MWSLYDHLFSSIFWCTGTVAIIINGYLLYLIFFHAPRTLQVYRVFLANVAIADLVFAAATTFAQIRLIPNKWAFAYVTLGPASFFGSQVSYIAYCVQLHALFYTFLSYPLSFGFRYHVLIRPMPTIRNCILLCFALWLIAFAQHILFIFSETDAHFIREYLSINKPQYNLTEFVISGNHMIKSPLTVITLASIVLPMFPIYVLVIYFYKKVHGYLAVNTRLPSNVMNNCEKKTRIGHHGDDSIVSGAVAPRSFRGRRRVTSTPTALIIQASLPLLFIFPPITIYGLYHLEFINFTIIEYLVYVLFSFYPAASPMVTLYFVKPFNLAVRRLLGIPIKTKVRGVTMLMSANKVTNTIYYDENAGSFSTDFFL